ncbi:MAG: exosortase/archaeosortase family protein [Planctomycetaceae bacterium]
MKTPASILPPRPPGQLSPGPAVLADEEPNYSDESLGEGLRRRLGELQADLRRPEDATAWILIAILTGALVYSYWPGLMNARASWNNPQYSHGWLVPLCSLGLLFWWRRPMAPVPPSARLAGLGLIAGSFVFRLACAYFRIITLDMYTFVPALAGVFLMIGGWRTFRWAWTPLVALMFMYPLPDEATRYLLGPLQTLATMVSTFALQTLGLDAYREGNKIVLGETQVLGVVDACSGLRMLTIFVWLALMIVLVAGGEWWEKLVILASAIPIALVVNSIRITVTGALYTVSPEMAEKIFHDWAGYFMMPLALLLLFGLQQLLASLVVEEEVAPAVVVRGRPAGLGPAVVSPLVAPRKTPENRPLPDAGAARGPVGGN